jgi:hypothetical protein
MQQIVIEPPQNARYQDVRVNKTGGLGSEGVSREMGRDQQAKGNKQITPSPASQDPLLEQPQKSWRTQQVQPSKQQMSRHVAGGGWRGEMQGAFSLMEGM